jgi:hypothetical protein
MRHVERERTMTNLTIAESWKTAWEGLLTGTETRELTRQGARSLSDGQQRILNSLEDFTSGWFERREVGVRAAEQAVQNMCGAPTLVEAFTVWQTWAAGAAERIAADATAWQQCVTACGAPLGKFVPQADAPKLDAKASKSAGLSKAA